MAKVEITENLKEEIFNKFKGESNRIFNSMYSLEENPKKGKFIGQISNVAIKELKYKGFRFYFIANNYKIRFLSAEKLKDLLIKFVRMSNKNSQQKVIGEIKSVLKNLGRGILTIET